MEKKFLIAIFLQFYFGSWAQKSSDGNLRVALTCPPNVTITGSYTTVYTNSHTWIVSSGVTTIPAGANVTLDANPITDGFVEMNPGFETLPGSEFLAIVLTPCDLAGPLPVKLISFSAKAQENQVLLNWETSSEINSAGFVVERSENGKEFTKIGFVKSEARNGKSNEKLVYEFIDISPKDGNNYYRLKQLDLDGKLEYSQIKSVKIEGKGVVNIFPNPTSDYITIEIFGDKIKSIELLNANGSILYQSNSVENRIDVSKHPSGIYFVKIVNIDGKVLVRKVLKN
jgi:hypothetical protein